MKVKDIMSLDLNFVQPSTKVTDIAMMMKQKDIGSVPVVQNDQVVGMVTDRDILLRVIADQKDVKQTTAQQIMTPDPICIEESDDIDTAADRMAEHQVKRLPVLNKGKLVGMIALGDLAIEHIHIDEAGEALNGISKGITH